MKQTKLTFQNQTMSANSVTVDFDNLQDTPNENSQPPSRLLEKAKKIVNGFWLFPEDPELGEWRQEVHFSSIQIYFMKKPSSFGTLDSNL